MTLYTAPTTSPRTARRSSLGGKIHIEERAVPNMGAFSLFTGAEGRMMGIWKTVKT
jgi:predicted enzyme related to lactoylglutathione lyase